MTRIANATTESDEHKEIEITEEMIAVGEDVIWGAIGDADVGGYFSASDLAIKVYRAMVAANLSRQD
jgi:hypothetical protein